MRGIGDVVERIVVVRNAALRRARGGHARGIGRIGELLRRDVVARGAGERGAAIDARRRAAIGKRCAERIEMRARHRRCEQHGGARERVPLQGGVIAVIGDVGDIGVDERIVGKGSRMVAVAIARRVRQGLSERMPGCNAAVRERMIPEDLRRRTTVAIWRLIRRLMRRLFTERIKPPTARMRQRPIRQIPVNHMRPRAANRKNRVIRQTPRLRTTASSERIRSQPILRRRPAVHPREAARRRIARNERIA
nr:hypothetical protein [Caballeronia sp. Lep1P3]